MRKKPNVKDNVKHKHLSLEQRTEIEAALVNGRTFRAIGCLVGKDPGTVAREVRLNRFQKATVQPLSRLRNNCRLNTTCEVRHICGKQLCPKLCRSCTWYNCNFMCRTFEDQVCARLEKAPYVCNGCSTRQHCRLTKYWYRATQAEQAYRDRLSGSRRGINLSPDELAALDDLVTPLLRQGQSINHIFASHAVEIGCSRKTLYSYISQGCLSVINLDLPRQVRYKKRRKRRKEAPANPKYRIGRTYEDFVRLTALNPDLPVIELDTVEGSDCSEVLLTLLFRQSKLMLVELLPAQTQACVLRAFDALETALGPDAFAQTFPVILTDNGSEFKNPDAIECSLAGGIRSRVFYCNPGASWQKGALEKNHEYIRYVLPKGVSFAWLKPDMVKLLRDHINSTRRDALNKNSPLDLATLLLSKPVIEQLCLRRIPPDDIILKPTLLKS